MEYIVLQTFTFCGAEKAFSILAFSLGVKGGDRSFTSGGCSRYSAGIEQRIHAIKSMSTVPRGKTAMGGRQETKHTDIHTSLV